MKPLDRATIAEIAARYAAEVAPDVRAVVVPQGQMGQPDTVWIGSRRFCNTPGVSNNWKGQNYTIGTPKRLSERSQKSAETRHKLATLHAQGLDDDELCAAMGMGPETLRVMRHHMRLRANARKRPDGPPSVKGVGDERAQKLRRLHGFGLTNKEIAEAGGGTYYSVKKAIRLLGLSPNRK